MTLIKYIVVHLHVYCNYTLTFTLTHQNKNQAYGKGSIDFKNELLKSLMSFNTI